MIFKFKKLNLCNFFPIFLCLSAPAFFPFRWHLRTRHPPSKSPAFPPFIFSFRGRPSQPPSPQQFPLSSSLSERPTDRIYTQNQTVPFKIEAFPGGSSLAQGRRKGLFRGILEYLGSKNRPRSGRFWGRSWGEFQGLFRRRIPLKGRKSGDVGVEKWVQKRARSDLLRALLRVSLFERFYARLKSDGISRCKRLF